MKKDSVILGVAAAVIVAGIAGAVVAGRLKKQEVPDVRVDGSEDSLATEEAQVISAGFSCRYTGEMEISNIDITLDEINRLKVYALAPPEDEYEYITALAMEFLGDAYEKADVSVRSHESTAGPEMEGWGNRYTYTDGANGTTLFEGGLYSSSLYVRRDICDTEEELIGWIDELIERNRLGVWGEDIHMEADHTARSIYTWIPYFGIVPKGPSSMHGSMDPPDEQGVRYEGYLDVEFGLSGGTLTDALVYSMEVTDRTELTERYSSLEEIYQMVYDWKADGDFEEIYEELVLDRMELYYNIGIKNDGTFVATPWVSISGRQRICFTEFETEVSEYDVTYNVNLETGRVYQGL